MATLSAPQQKLLTQAENLAKRTDHGMLVSGTQYRTAIALEKRGLGTVRYQGPSLGWFKANVASNIEQATKILSDLRSEQADGNYTQHRYELAHAAIAYAIEHGFKP